MKCILRTILVGLATKYRDTPMAGRTHLQQALPVTSGYKAAVWLAMFDRHAEGLEQPTQVHVIRRNSSSAA